jgi:hypothetical protein
MSLGRDDRAHPTGTPSQDLTTDLIVMNPCGLDVTDVDAAYSLLAERVAENLHGLPHPSKEQCANAVQDALRACGRADVSAASVRRIVRAVRSRHGL